jgi:hypothetical protein
VAPDRGAESSPRYVPGDQCVRLDLTRGKKKEIKMKRRKIVSASRGDNKKEIRLEI